MRVWGAGYNWIHPSEYFCSRPCGTCHYTLILVKTKSIFVLNSETHEVEPNTLILIEKDFPHSYRAVEGNYTDDYVNFDATDEEIKQITQEYKIPLNTFIYLDYAMPVSQLFKNLASENLSPHELINEIRTLYVKLILCKAYELFSTKTDIRKNPYYAQFEELRNSLYSNPQKDWSVDIVATQLKLSRSYVQHLYKDFFDVSINQDITESRIEYAKYLLSNTRMPISAVAESCRYNSDVHFMRIFKRLTQLTPTQYKSQSEKLLISYPPPEFTRDI